MQTRLNTKFIIGLIFLWTVTAFFLILSPLAESIRFKLPFRTLNIPIAYWSWVMTGLVFIYASLCKYSIGASLRAFIPVGIIFHLTIFMSDLVWNDRICSAIDGRYLLYIFFVVYLFTAASSLWAMYPLHILNMRKILLRLPLVFAPFLSLSYSIYKGSAVGIIIFGACIVPILALFFFRKLFNALNAFLRIINAAFAFIKNNEKALLWTIFLVAFFVRILFSFILIAKTGSDYVLASDDGDGYDQIAVSLSGSPVKNWVAILAKQPWPPVYLVFLGVIYKIFGQNFHAATIIQSILGAGIAILIYLLTKRIFNKSTAIIAASLIVLAQPLIFLSAVLGTEAVYVPLVVSAIFISLSALYFDREKIYAKAILAGVTFGLAAMTLGTITLFPIIVFIFMILPRILRRPFFKRLKIASTFFAFFFATFFLLKAVYVMESGTWKGGYEEAGHYLWSLRTPFNYEVDPDNRKFMALGIYPFTKPIESIKIAFNNPREVLSIGLEVFPTRIRNFFLWGNFGSFDPIFLTNPTRLPSRFASNLEFYTLVFFFIGLFFSLRGTRRSAVFFILIFMGYYTFIHAILFIAHTMRYSAPVKPFSIMFLSYGLFSAYRYFSKQNDTA
ncbi:MAG: glycosyltransferase family 39 protein [Omnitrophica bacterium]|nr:glycosyltransferase family 39 protein [Candidatus Omnitrophota bacterium]